jgi:hypothetical protein
MEAYLNAYFTRMLGIFGTADALAEDFLAKKTVEKILAMPDGPGKESAKMGAGAILPELKKRVTSEELKGRIQTEIEKLSSGTGTAAAAGGRRKMSRKYCKKTTCKKMGFSQRSSCRPYKNCFTRKQGRSRY